MPVTSLDRDGERKKKFGVPSPLAARPADRDRRLAARQEQDRLSERPIAERDLARNRGMHPTDFPRLAFDRIRENDGPRPVAPGFPRRRLPAIARRMRSSAPRSAGSAVVGLGRIGRRIAEMTHDRIREGKPIFPDDGKCVRARRAVRNRGTGRDEGGLVAGNVRDDQRDDPGRERGRRKPSALDRRYMLAHRVHRRDGCAGGKQRAIDGDLVGKGQPGRRGGQQGRSAARDEGDDEVVGSETTIASRRRFAPAEAVLVRTGCEASSTSIDRHGAPYP